MPDCWFIGPGFLPATVPPVNGRQNAAAFDRHSLSTVSHTELIPLAARDWESLLPVAVQSWLIVLLDGQDQSAIELVFHSKVRADFWTRTAREPSQLLCRLDVGFRAYLWRRPATVRVGGGGSPFRPYGPQDTRTSNKQRSDPPSRKPPFHSHNLRSAKFLETSRWRTATHLTQFLFQVT